MSQNWMKISGLVYQVHGHVHKFFGSSIMPSFEAMAFRKFWGQFLVFVKVSWKLLRPADPMSKYPLPPIRVDVRTYLIFPRHLSSFFHHSMQMKATSRPHTFTCLLLQFFAAVFAFSQITILTQDEKWCNSKMFLTKSPFNMSSQAKFFLLGILAEGQWKKQQRCNSYFALLELHFTNKFHVLFFFPLYCIKAPL